MTDTQILKRRIKEACAAVGAARRTLANGDMVDLAGLEREVEEICGGIAQVPAAEAQGFKASLVSLAGDLDLLSRDLKGRHVQLAGEIQEVNARQQATKAYGHGKGR